MRNLSYGLFLCGLAVLTPMPQVLAGEFKLEEGFSLLFNGKTLDGWRERKSKDTLEGKTEAFKGRFKVVDGGILNFNEGNAYIETTKAYAKDVHFKFDFRAGPKCNNDILFRGVKFDIVPGNKENKEVKEGEWYAFELIAKGDTLEFKVGGETVRRTKTAAKASEFTLRAEFGKMDVKNLRAKE